MRQFEQDWLELGSRVTRSLHYQHRRNLRQVEAAGAKGAAEELGPSLGWPIATPVRITKGTGR
jgi:hypothetical protein